MENTPDPAAVSAYLRTLQEHLCQALGAQDGTRTFREDVWQRPGGGGGCSRILEDGAVIERLGINFSHVRGERLPSSASAHRPELAERPFQIGRAHV